MIFTDLLTDYAGGDDDEGVDQNSPDSQGSGRFSLAEVSITWFEENQRVRLCCNRGYVRLRCILTLPPDSIVSKRKYREISELLSFYFVILDPTHYPDIR